MVAENIPTMTSIGAGKQTQSNVNSDGFAVKAMPLILEKFNSDKKNNGFPPEQGSRMQMSSARCVRCEYFIETT